MVPGWLISLRWVTIQTESFPAPPPSPLPHRLITTHPISHSPVHFPQSFPIKSDLPVFTPIHSSPTFNSRRNPTPIYSNPPILASQKQKAQSRAGDISVLPLLVQKEKTEARELSTCLLAAVISGNTRIVYQLLVFGVSAKYTISPYRYH